VTALADALHQWRDANGPFSPALLAKQDSSESFPVQACRALDDSGLPSYYVPARHGGRLTEFPQVVAMLRMVARHDLTVAVAHGKTFLGAVSAWVAGTPEQARWLGEQVMDRAVVCWGLTERGHGSDILAGELSAEWVSDGWRLNGEKWLINNATRAQLVCVLARTSNEGGPRGYSLFLVDKRQLSPDRFRLTPKIATHGIRGADISGISFHDAVVPATSLVGTLGAGGEIVLKSLQLTRTACAALSLGAGDHALRLATQFATQRRLYGRLVSEMPLAHGLIGRAAAGLLLAEALTVTATRALHLFPGEMSVFSAVCKAFVPTIVQETIGSVAELLGARGYLTEVFEHGEFAKLDRDHRLIGIFDGSTLVNRQLLITQFTRLGRRYGEIDGSVAERLGGLVSGPLPEFDPERLTLFSKTGANLAQAVPGLLQLVRERGGGDAAWHSALSDFERASAEVHTAISAYRPTSGMPGAEAFRLAERYEFCLAGAACLLILALQQDNPANYAALRACLELATSRLLPDRREDHDAFAVLGRHALATTEPLTLFAGDREDMPW
jgi:alkylation response protein AidB-like acyl-CoA dehydrogenase